VNDGSHNSAWSNLSALTHMYTDSIMDNDEHHPELLGRFVIMAPSINVQTYLLKERPPVCNPQMFP